jgi:threonyl-tRNA synthetase
MAQPIYTREYVESITVTHLPPANTRQRFALRFIGVCRTAFDLVTGYKPNAPNDPAVWLRRFVFLETVAGVPGMVAAALRHLQSLRLMKYDGGFINDLLQESENERMHLMTFMELRKPGPLFRFVVHVRDGCGMESGAAGGCTGRDHLSFFFLVHDTHPQTPPPPFPAAHAHRPPRACFGTCTS